MTGNAYYSNLALHISDATLKGKRRLRHERAPFRLRELACMAFLLFAPLALLVFA